MASNGLFGDAVSGMVSGSLGVVGDIVGQYRALYDTFYDPALKNLPLATRAEIAQQRAQESVGGTNWIGRKMGADPESGAFVAGSLVQPGMLSKAGPMTTKAIGNVNVLYGKSKANKAIHMAETLRKNLKRTDPNMTEDQIKDFIWRETGRKTGVPLVEVQPGEWASEIPDIVQARMLPKDFSEGKLKDVMPGIGALQVNSAAVRRAVEDLPVKMRGDLPQGTYGGLDSGIDVKTGKKTPREILLNQTLTADQLENTAAHEAGQHATSTASGWFTGGNPQQFMHATPSAITMNRDFAAPLRAAADIMRQAGNMGMTYREFVTQFPNMVPEALKSLARQTGQTLPELGDTLRRMGGGLLTPNTLEHGATVAERRAQEGQDIMDWYRKTAPQDVQQKLAMRAGSSAPAYYRYGNLADEAFARATGNRVNKDMQYRIENPFFNSGEMSFVDEQGRVLWTPTLDQLVYER